MIPATPIFLNDEDSKKFLVFMEHYDAFSTLLDHGCFTMVSGECTIYYNGEGKIRRIERKFVDVL